MNVVIEWTAENLSPTLSIWVNEQLCESSSPTLDIVWMFDDRVSYVCGNVSCGNIEITVVQQHCKEKMWESHIGIKSYEWANGFFPPA